MANNLKCSLCEQVATVHLTQIINNKVQKIDLCEACAQKKGVTDPEGFSLAEMLSNNNFLNTGEMPTCEQCGIRIADFKKEGRFGCPSCYLAFKDSLKPVLEEMHVGTVHRGKVPEKSMQQISLSEKIKHLKEQLVQAIKDEAYEDAALIRDELELVSKEQLESTN